MEPRAEASTSAPSRWEMTASGHSRRWPTFRYQAIADILALQDDFRRPHAFVRKTFVFETRSFSLGAKVPGKGCSLVEQTSPRRIVGRSARWECA